MQRVFKWIIRSFVCLFVRSIDRLFVRVCVCTSTMSLFSFRMSFSNFFGRLVPVSIRTLPSMTTGCIGFAVSIVCSFFCFCFLFC